MKRVGNKYAKIIAIENLRKGAYNAMKGKDSRRSLKEIKYFKDNEEELLLKLHNELKEHTYTLHKGEKKIIFTSSVNIRERLEDYPPERFPCYATITLDGKAFILN